MTYFPIFFLVPPVLGETKGRNRRGSPEVFQQNQRCPGHKTAGSKTQVHLGRIEWAWCGRSFSLFELSAHPLQCRAYLGREHRNTIFTGDRGRGGERKDKGKGSERKGCQKGSCMTSKERGKGGHPARESEPKGEPCGWEDPREEAASGKVLWDEAANPRPIRRDRHTRPARSGKNSLCCALLKCASFFILKCASLSHARRARRAGRTQVARARGLPPIAR